MRKSSQIVEQNRDLLEAAQAAAARGDAHGMIEALFECGFMDGLVIRLTGQWGRQIGQAEIRDVVANSVDKAYDAIKSKKVIRNVGGWIFKVANREIVDHWNDDHKPRVNSAKLDSKICRPAPISETERAEIDQDRDLCRGQAVEIARRLLAEVGEGQVRDVMTLVIDAVEQGIPDLPPSQIADSLGISADSARTLLSRGFRRMERAARNEGIEWPDSIAYDELDVVDTFQETHRDQEDNIDAE